MAKQPTLRAYVDEHEGEKFLVCGMGTSIDQYPAEFYETWDGITIGVNEITALFTPDYLLPNCHKDYHPEYENTLLKRGLDRPISFEYTSPSSRVDVGKTGKLSKRGTCAVPAFTAAYQLGASEIYVIGVDFMAGEDGRIYFKGCPKEAPKRYQLADPKDPELQATLRCFSHIFDEYRARGVGVFNLSKTSRLENIKTVEL